MCPMTANTKSLRELRRIIRRPPIIFTQEGNSVRARLEGSADSVFAVNEAQALLRLKRLTGMRSMSPKTCDERAERFEKRGSRK